jgi:Na+:H+ antiporter, NhaC family
MRVALIPVIFLVVSPLLHDHRLRAASPTSRSSLATAVATIVAMLHKQSWKEIEKGMVHGITLALAPILILMIVGNDDRHLDPGRRRAGDDLLRTPTAVAGHLPRGHAPHLHDRVDRNRVVVVNGRNGGRRPRGVGHGLGIPAPMVAGAIISGAYFGDHMSPLSDATNLAPAVAGADLFAHIRHTMYTAVPGYIITLVAFLLLGMRFHAESAEPEGITLILTTLQANFFIHPIVLLPPVLVVVMVVRRIPPLPALLAGMVIGGIFGVFAQGRSIAEIVQAAQSGFVSTTGIAVVDGLLTRGGLESMMSTVALVISALSFGGVMEKTGMLGVIAEALLKKVRTVGSLVATTVFSCIGMNAIGSDQYLAIVIPGRMYKNAFDARGLHPKNLSRALGNSGRSRRRSSPGTRAAPSCTRRSA